MSRHAVKRRSPLVFAYDHPELVCLALLVAFFVGSVVTR